MRPFSTCLFAGANLDLKTFFIAPDCFYPVWGSRLWSCNFSDLHWPHPGGCEPVPGAGPLLQSRHGVPVPRPEDRGAWAARVRAGGGGLQEPPGERGQSEPRHLRRVRGGEDGDHQVHPGVSLQVKDGVSNHLNKFHLKNLILSNYRRRGWKENSYSLPITSYA